MKYTKLLCTFSCSRCAVPLKEKTREQLDGELKFPHPYSCDSCCGNNWEQLGTTGNNWR